MPRTPFQARPRLPDLAVPVGAFLLARSLLWVASWTAGYGFPGASDLTRNDSFLYLSVARHGYTLFECHRVGGWCGNSGWFPLYPLLLAAVHPTGMSAQVAGVALSALFQLATLLVLWIYFLNRRNDLRSVLCLVCAAFFPGAIYYAAVFPLSLLTMLTLAAVAFTRASRTRAALLIVALAAMSYPLGVLVGVALAVDSLGTAGRAKRRLRRGAEFVGASATGLAALALTQRLTVGHWDAYLLVQRHYRPNRTNPVETLRFAKEVTFTFLHDPRRLELVPQVQVIFVAGIVLAAILAWLRHRDTADFPLVVFTTCAWAMPLLLGGVSLYRSDAALLPGLVVIRKAPPLLLAAIACVGAAIGVEMNRLFFLHVLA